MDFRKKTITLMGLGVQGGAVEDALFFIRSGVKHLIITDLKQAHELKSSLQKLKPYRKQITYHLGGHKPNDFIKTDLIIKNPGVRRTSPFLRIAQKHRVPIDTSIGIFFRNANLKYLIGVTGTKGKSSTAALIYAAVKKIDPKAYCAGNIGVSPLRYLKKAQNHWGILELSSWQLESLKAIKKSPRIAVFTNMAEDHLNSYKSMHAYREAKSHIFRYQRKNDIAVLNYDDVYLRKIAKQVSSQVRFFSAKKRPLKQAGVYKKNTNFFYGGSKIGEWPIESVQHHPANIAAALTVASALNIDLKSAFRAMVGFPGLTGRLEHIATIDGIDIINDTTATNPFATLHSLDVFKEKRVALILGGENKNVSYRTLVKKLPIVFAIALLPGSASDTIKREAQRLNFRLPIQNVTSLKEAVRWTFQQHPEVILFSPAAASFNMFQNEFDRGDAFNKIIRVLKHAQKKRGG